MGHKPRPGSAHLLHRQLDPEGVACFAVVEHGDRPSDLGPFGIVGRMVVSSVVGELLHAEQSIRSAIRRDGGIARVARGDRQAHSTSCVLGALLAAVQYGADGADKTVGGERPGGDRRCARREMGA